MTVYTIKGLYIGKYGEEKNPTYFGTLGDAVRYASNTYNFTHKGEDVVICEGETPKAIQKWVKKVDEIGEYYEPLEWEVL